MEIWGQIRPDGRPISSRTRHNLNFRPLRVIFTPSIRLHPPHLRPNFYSLVSFGFRSIVARYESSILNRDLAWYAMTFKTTVFARTLFGFSLNLSFPTRCFLHCSPVNVFPKYKIAVTRRFLQPHVVAALMRFLESRLDQNWSA